LLVGHGSRGWLQQDAAAVGCLAGDEEVGPLRRGIDDLHGLSLLDGLFLRVGEFNSHGHRPKRRMGHSVYCTVWVCWLPSKGPTPCGGIGGGVVLGDDGPRLL